MEFDHLTIAKVLGSGVSVSSTGNRTRPELLAMIMTRVYVSDMEQGAFSEFGLKTASTEKMRPATTSASPTTRAIPTSRAESIKSISMTRT